MLRLDGFLGFKSGMMKYASPSTPVGGVVGGMPCALVAATGKITLATSYTLASGAMFNRVVGLFRYNEATMLQNTPNYESTYLCGFGSEVTILQGTDYQSQNVDDVCPYDSAQVYAYGDPLYVNTLTGQWTNQVGSATATAVAGAMVLVIPASTGGAMRIKLLL